MFKLMVVLLICAQIPYLHASDRTDVELPRAVTDALASFDKTVAQAANQSANRARVALEQEIKRRTQAGDLDTALAAKDALQSIEARLDKFRNGVSLPISPVGKWQRQDGRVLVIEHGGKGMIFRGNESPEPLQWRPDGERYALTFPTLTNMPGIVTYVWPDGDGSWSYAFTDGVKVGTMKKMP